MTATTPLWYLLSALVLILAAVSMIVTGRLHAHR
jgi:hypothetical protein